jgi:hypothetical protein
VSGATAAVSQRAPRRSALGWPDVLRGLGRDAARSYALDRLRGCGFSADSFGAARNMARPHREHVADVLTATEDWLEGQHRLCADEHVAEQAKRRRTRARKDPTP